MCAKGLSSHQRWQSMCLWWLRLKYGKSGNDTSLKFLCDCSSSLEMEGADGEAAGEVFLLCATNCPWELDTAFLRRFQRRIHIPLPCRWGPVNSGRCWGMVATSWNTGDTYPTLHYHDSWQENSYHVITHCYHIKTLMMSHLHHYPHWLSCINLVIRAINQNCMFRPIGLLQLQHHSCYNHSADCEGSGNRLAIYTYHCIWLAEIVFWYW